MSLALDSKKTLVPGSIASVMPNGTVSSPMMR